MKNLNREKYLLKIRPFYNKQLIKVISGQRRVGKSFFLRQVMNELKEINPKSNFIFIDKEKFEFDAIKSYADLITYINERLKPELINYLFIDEVQEIIEFEKALRSLLSEGNFDIYCTGSNMQVFSGELATLLSGRQIEIRIHALSYPEFLTFHHLENNKNSFNKFIKYGGLPYLIHLEHDDEVIFDYLKNIYDTILFRDVLARNNLRDQTFLQNLIYYLAINSGNIISANKIADYLKSIKSDKTVAIIINYLYYIQQAYIISGVKRKEISGKKIFENGVKYYFEDLGLRNAVCGFKPGDIHIVLENLVYNHLITLGYEIYVGKIGTNEVDFIAEKKGETIYFQVTYMLNSENVLGREFGNLNKIDDNFPKYVVSMDDVDFSTSYKGIKQINIIDFLNTTSF